MSNWWVYMVRCSDRSLYCGTTTDVGRRVAEHNGSKGAKCLRGKLPVALAYQEPVSNKNMAQRREREIKRLTKKQKESLCRSYR